uniref:Uncharacterized protein n=1 Tax=Amphimedon queenslandica TaxID=400682 RepID=A0A1X7STI3_AMPQE
EDDREDMALRGGNTEEKETEESTEIQDKEPVKVSFEATSVRRQNFGRTTHLETLTVDDCPDLRDYALYLTSSTGAGKSDGVSKSEVTDLGKFLKHSGSSTFAQAFTKDKVTKYIDFLEKTCKVGPCGRSTKCNTILHAITYLKRKPDISQDDFF